MTSPRALTGLEGACVGGRFKLEGAGDDGFTSRRYCASDDAGVRWLVTLLDPALAASAPTRLFLDGEVAKLAAVPDAAFAVPTATGVDDALGCAYLAEAQPAGRSLARHLKEEGRLDSRAAIRLLSKLASALVPLHSAGLAHRAITAESIFVTREGRELVADLRGFGDGLLQPNSAAIELDRDAQLAPEIADGQRGGPAADVWALAAVLHQTVDASADEHLTALLARCLDDEPKNRPFDAAAFRQQLAGSVGARTDEGGLSLDATAEADGGAGRFIAEYEIVSLIGEGGMGAVYEVRDRAGERFALKVIRGDGKGPRERRRFGREVKAAMELHGDNIARVQNSGVDPRTGAPFMVMDLLHGADVATTLKRQGRLEVAVATRIAADACNGLIEAHARGLIHRDIKPPNLFLHEVDGHIVTKICDFGIVKDTALNQANTVLTRTGALIGSPSYMSPEQARDSSVVDARTDIWSLSATLYEMLAGVAPWDGAKNVGEILLLLHRGEVPRLDEVAPWVGEAVAAVVHRGLAPDPSERFQSASALQEALLPFAAPSPLLATSVTGVEHRAPSRAAHPRSGATSTLLQPASLPASPARGWLLPATVAVAAAAALGIAAWRASRTDPSAPQPTSSSLTPEASCDLASCGTSNGGRPSRCRADGVCVALESDQCHILADEAALRDPHTLWIGAMFPAADKDTLFAAFGRASEHAVDLARRDFASVGGLPRNESAPARGIAVVACEDSSNARAAAQHLVAVGVPAVIGFRSSNDVIQLAQSEFIPHDVLVIPSLNSSSLITGIPHPANTPRLVFRTAITNETAVDAVAALITSDVGPLTNLGPNPVKLLLVRSQDSVGLALSEAVFNKVRVNGKPIAELGERFRELSFADSEARDGLRKLAATALELLPDVLILHATTEAFVEDFLIPLEQNWPRGARRPLYILPGSVEGALSAALAKDNLAARLFSMATVYKTPANLKFTNAYNAAFNERLPPSEAPGAPYDSLYLIAYAAYASSKAEPSGSDLARAMTRLLPPGKAIDIGPAGILDAFSELDRGGSIDLQGTYSRLDFDLKTGESPADYAILCTRKTADEKTFEGVESGLVYDSALKKMTGTFNCK